MHLEVRVIALETEEETRCEIGLIVHPVNSAPEIAVDESRLLSATNGGLVKPHKDIHLHGVIRLWPWLCQAVFCFLVCVFPQPKANSINILIQAF